MTKELLLSFSIEVPLWLCCIVLSSSDESEDSVSLLENYTLLMYIITLLDVKISVAFNGILRLFEMSSDTSVFVDKTDRLFLSSVIATNI